MRLAAAVLCCGRLQTSWKLCAIPGSTCTKVEVRGRKSLHGSVSFSFWGGSGGEGSDGLGKWCLHGWLLRLQRDVCVPLRRAACMCPKGYLGNRVSCVFVSWDRITTDGSLLHGKTKTACPRWSWPFCRTKTTKTTTPPPDPRFSDMSTAKLQTPTTVDKQSRQVR